eukprot:10008229-Ditylum_brightwellii.AAC.1
MDAVYTLEQGLLWGNAPTAFNSKQATFKEQMLDNIEKCLNAVMGCQAEQLSSGASYVTWSCTKKLDQKDLLEVLENGMLTLWKFQMDKKGFNANSITVKEFTKT